MYWLLITYVNVFCVDRGYMCYLNLAVSFSSENVKNIVCIYKKIVVKM